MTNSKFGVSSIPVALRSNKRLTNPRYSSCETQQLLLVVQSALTSRTTPVRVTQVRRHRVLLLNRPFQPQAWSPCWYLFVTFWRTSGRSQSSVDVGSLQCTCHYGQPSGVLTKNFLGGLTPELLPFRFPLPWDCLGELLPVCPRSWMQPLPGS